MDAQEFTALTKRLFALPPADRLALADILWQSLPELPISDEELAMIRERQREMESGGVGQSHELVMQRARQRRPD